MKKKTNKNKLYLHKRIELCENAQVRYYKYYKRSLFK